MLPLLLLPLLWIIGVFSLLTLTIIHFLLGLIGFGAAGPVAGSLAALIQSSIGNVVAGSLFALLQSIAMGGSLWTIVSFFGKFVGSIIGWLVLSGKTYFTMLWYVVYVALVAP
ncbi:hypothetical protein EDD18DRAFT_1171421 [Armillaria luteobubalina]|uniref:Uncharacterized protein n=1 Tax=Armillaria luteobubalina TaxID=153913 RepID=A0AA39Q2W9_9AGAR|nr:hypothetical protein EDD18DRAFT_1171421 [Armillaria luteobubalina]